MQYLTQYAVLYFILASYLMIRLIKYTKPEHAKLNPKPKLLYIIGATVFALVVRVLSAMLFRGFPTDIDCFLGWAEQLAETGPWNFYSEGSFSDYPPGYMWVLWLLGYVIKLFNITAPLSWLIIKVPAIISDCVIGVILYRLTCRRYNEQAAMAVFLLFAFNPLVLVNSVFWGQIESVLVLLLVLSFNQYKKGKLINAALLFTAAALIKPQALLLLPIYAFLYLRNDSGSAIKTPDESRTKNIIILKSVAYSLGLLWIACIPFSNAWSDVSGFLDILAGIFDFTWVFGKYSDTLASYPYATVNAFNFYALIGANFRSITERFLFSTYEFWGNIVIIAAFAYAIYGIVKGNEKNPGGRLLFAATVIFLILFTFGIKMHERYVYPAVIFLLIAYIQKGDIRLLIGFVAYSIANAFNLIIVLEAYYLDKTDILAGGGAVFVSIMQVLIFSFAIFTLHKVYVMGEVFEMPSISFRKNRNSAEQTDTNEEGMEDYTPHKPFFHGFFLLSNDFTRKLRFGRCDALALSVITLAYSTIAFYNLGGKEAPQTFYVPATAGEEFRVSFARPEKISRVEYYCGIGNTFGANVDGVDVTMRPYLELSYSVDGFEWVSVNSPPKTEDIETNITDPDASYEEKVEKNRDIAAFKSVFKWDYAEFPAITAKYIKGTPVLAYRQSNEPWLANDLNSRPMEINYTIGELAFFNTEGERKKLIPVENIISLSPGGGNPALMFDEQLIIPKHSSFQNGVYFDEVYHPRTAYEIINKYPYYETTHPPLGKLIIAIGVKLFGMTPFGWRIAGTVFGILMAPLFYLFLKLVFGRSRYAIIGTILFSFDFMHFSLTRMGTIDTYPVFFILASYFFMYRFVSRVTMIIKKDVNLFTDKATLNSLLMPLMASGILWGFSCASKWIGVYAGIGLALIFYVEMNRIYAALDNSVEFKKILLKICGWNVLFFVIAPALIYIISYIPISHIPGYEDFWNTMIKNQSFMFRYHAEYVLGSKHSFSSNWYEWPVMTRPLWAYQAETVSEGKIGSIMIMGNPAVWWAGLFAVSYGIYIGIRRRSRIVMFLGIAIFSQYVPWWRVERILFIYHFFASTPFMIMFIVYVLRELERRYPHFKYVTYAYTALVVVLFALFYPVLSGGEVSIQFVDDYLRWFDSWVFYSRG